MVVKVEPRFPCQEVHELRAVLARVEAERDRLRSMLWLAVECFRDATEDCKRLERDVLAIPEPQPACAEDGSF